TMRNLMAFEKDYSAQAGAIVGKVKTSLSNSRRAYQAATQSVYEWCGIAHSLLDAYFGLFKEFNADKADVQIAILIKVLRECVTKLGAAQKQLGESSASLNQAAGELSTLTTVLKADFDASSIYYADQKEKLRKEAYGGAAAGIIGGPLGLLISYSIAAGVLEG